MRGKGGKGRGQGVRACVWRQRLAQSLARPPTHPPHASAFACRFNDKLWSLPAARNYPQWKSMVRDKAGQPDERGETIYDPEVRCDPPPQTPTPLPPRSSLRLALACPPDGGGEHLCPPHNRLTPPHIRSPTHPPRQKIHARRTPPSRSFRWWPPSATTRALSPSPRTRPPPPSTWCARNSAPATAACSCPPPLLAAAAACLLLLRAATAAACGLPLLLVVSPRSPATSPPHLPLSSINPQEFSIKDPNFDLLGMDCTGDASESGLIKCFQVLRDVGEYARSARAWGRRGEGARCFVRA